VIATELSVLFDQAHPRFRLMFEQSQGDERVTQPTAHQQIVDVSAAGRHV
jgi:hypothetical protein